MQTTEGNLHPLGYQQLTSLATAAGLTAVAGGRVAIIQAESQAVRWRDDGTNPTTTVGMRIAAGSDYVYTGNISSLKFIEETASAKLNVSVYS